MPLRNGVLYSDLSNLSSSQATGPASVSLWVMGVWLETVLRREQPVWSGMNVVQVPFSACSILCLSLRIIGEPFCLS